MNEQRPTGPAPEQLQAHPNGQPQQPASGQPAQDRRDARGRFARGNGGGPGNPFARQSAALRQALLNAVTPQDLYPALQQAISLELSTIPVYLSGLFTLKETGSGQANAGVAEIMTSVLNEEMLHMCIAANTLTALGRHAGYEYGSRRSHLSRTPSWRYR